MRPTEWREGLLLSDILTAHIQLTALTGVVFQQCSDETGTTDNFVHVGVAVECFPYLRTGTLT